MALSVEAARALIDIEKIKYDQKTKKTILPYLETTFIYYVKPDKFNKFNLLICDILYKLFVDFRTIIEKEKKELERELKDKHTIINSYRAKLVALNLKRDKEETKHIIDTLNLSIIDNMITETETGINEANKEKDIKRKEYTEFLTKFNDPEQNEYSTEYLKYIICEFERTSFFKCYKIRESLYDKDMAFNLEQFTNGITIYKRLYTNSLEYFKERTDILNRVV